MAQYCRYCVYMVCGDSNWCEKKKWTFTDREICRTNKCREFELKPIDALQVNKNGYRPRKERQIAEDNQIKMEV
jgi:hypothetical protein|nr:MAG TPA: hypothetical protein [Caudoviricetes sp.]